MRRWWRGIVLVFRGGTHFAHIWRRVGDLRRLEAGFFEKRVNDFARLHQLLLKLAEGLFAEREGDRPNDKVRRHFAFRKALHGDVFIEPLVAARRVPEEPREKRHAENKGKAKHCLLYTSDAADER